MSSVPYNFELSRIQWMKKIDLTITLSQETCVNGRLLRYMGCYFNEKHSVKDENTVKEVDYTHRSMVLDWEISDFEDDTTLYIMKYYSEQRKILKQLRYETIIDRVCLLTKRVKVLL